MSPQAPMENHLPFAVPDISDAEIHEVVDSLRSGWLTTGPKTRRFEQDFAEFIGGDCQAIAVNSATSGLHLALEACGVGPGDEVITSTYTFTATAEVIRYLGADPVFVDIDPHTLNMDPDAVARAVTGRTRVIMPVHIGGLSCDMDRILQIAQAHGLRVVEDAAHALPATWRGTLIGALASDATVFSFYATKTLVTGEGGMVVTRDEQLAARCRVMRLHGIDRDAFDRYTSERPAWYYEVIAPGFKYNMTDVAAAIGIQQLRRIHDLRSRREAMARRYDRAFADLPVDLPASCNGTDLHAWHLYVLRLREEAPIGRDEFITRMSERRIGTSVHFIPLHRQPYWRETYRLSPGDFPRAEREYARAVSLPIYTRMTDDDQDRVIRAVREALG